MGITLFKLTIYTLVNLDYNQTLNKLTETLSLKRVKLPGCFEFRKTKYGHF